ncbi:MAG: PilZ domain-containing protein [Deltaproteobacteria bacterium]|nr:PilZ domain-containing protein [Deltaproteobacteria bacterium]
MTHSNGNGNERDTLRPHCQGHSGSFMPGDKRREIAKKTLINRLNHHNFTDSEILVNLAHTKYGSPISLRAKPLPCLGETLECTWVKAPGLEQVLKNYRYVNFILPDPHQSFLVEAVSVSLTDEKIILRLPETCLEIDSRQVIRHSCHDISVRLLQNGVYFQGALVDFSPLSFRVALTSLSDQPFQWLNVESSVHIVFSKGQEMLFSGDCAIMKQDCGQKTRSLVLRPLNTQIRRFKQKEFRSSRHKLIPSPNVVFRDPLTGKQVNLKVVDLSGSGFSVEEKEENSVLLPGRVLPEVNIDLAAIISLRCKAQVVYRTVTQENEEKRTVKCGLAILDMDIQEHVRLQALLNQVSDQDSYFCNRVDMDSLWELFFQTGFLYPEKYSFIQANKENFKKTYERLYTGNLHVARHFVYQKNGMVYGHVAMVRFFENTWLVHHHAANNAVHIKAGLSVLEQVGRSINDSKNLTSTRMNFVACYYRPENRFPKRIFGRIAEQINDRNGCSIDSFAYLHYRKSSLESWDLSGPWSLTKTQAEDLAELDNFYRHVSGGLLVNALDLEPEMLEVDEIAQEFEKVGFKKEKYLFSLKKDGNLKAVFVVNVSDIALNMSDLTNCIHTIVVDPEDFPRGTLFMIYSLLSKYYDSEYVPILLYPVSYADNHQIEYDKIYSLWILNMQYTDSYFRYVDRIVHHCK